MKLGGVVLATGLAVALGGALLHLVPPNLTPDDGAADPFLFLRRPIVRALAAAGLLDRDCGLPYESRRSVRRVLPTGEELPVCETRITREPVYRGPFWRVGRRVTYRLEYFREWGETWRKARLCYAEGAERFVAAESGAPDPQVIEVSGFVPDSARGHWIEFTDDTGANRWLEAHGSTEPFVGD